MAEYLLDTDHLSYIQEQHPRVMERLAALPPADRVLTSVVNAAELLHGVYLLPQGRRRRHLLQLYDEVIVRLEEVVPVTLAVAERFATTAVKLRAKGRPIPVHDVWVAAVALVRGAILVTNDDHFSYVDGLRTANWTR